jgi:uncharacterized glyoxalase superfamily protein PhnB
MTVCLFAQYGETAMTSSQDLLAGMKQMRVAVPAKDFAQSRKFYEAIGFETATVAPTLMEVRLGQYAFFLQDLYDKAWAEKFTFHINVEDSDTWWQRIQPLKLHETFGVKEPEAPKVMSWGLKVMHLYDPSGVTWVINSPAPKQEQAQSQQSSRSGGAQSQGMQGQQQSSSQRKG